MRRQKGKTLEPGRSNASRCRWRSSEWAACSPRPRTSPRYWANIRDRRRRDHRGPRDPLAARRLLRRRPQGPRPDLRPPRRLPRPRSTSPPLDFGIAPNNLDATDTTQLLGLLVARQALEDAGYGEGSAEPLDRDRVSVILGVTGTLELVIPLGARLGHPIWRRALKAAGRRRRQPPRRSSGGSPTPTSAGRRTRSPACSATSPPAGSPTGSTSAAPTASIDAACASSLGAVNLALLELAAGRCDIALTGGLDTFNDIFMYMCFSKTPALSPTGDARPFDAAATGRSWARGWGSWC